MFGDGFVGGRLFFAVSGFFFQFICGWLLMLGWFLVVVVVVVGMSTFEKSC